ncbi:hypothetical protein LLE49_05990 [Alicyclobacillus tolerans]|uniref:hypothetical protein n=1 Tax=Alicyclobacillus tolerans TaxID=90970 RepID=UPI001F3E31E0|nr:hypothetical protein [Alicyclobacillus tolerans]MCF8564293.1 hypothetical protein [Alicyclobacillus tolerans]
MISFIVAAVGMGALIWVLDFTALRQTRSVKDRWMYGVLTGLGMALLGVYLTAFDLQSPLDAIQEWLAPLTGWMSS